MTSNLATTEQAIPDVAALLLADKRSPNTQEAYRRDLRAFFGYLGQEPTPEAVRAFVTQPQSNMVRTVYGYKAKVMAEGLSEATVNRRLSAVRSLVSFANRLDLTECTLAAVQGLKVKSYRDTTGPTREEVAGMLAAVDTGTEKGRRDLAILRLLWELGLRRSEVASLDVQDFDAQSRTLQVRGKGRGTQQEPMRLSEKATAALVAYLGERAEGPLFANVDRARKGAGRMTARAVYNVVRDCAQKAGLSRVISPHRVRHGAITEALNLTNGNVRAVQQFSRHAKAETVLRYDDNRSGHQEKVTALLAAAC
jgi:integrase/recombinase XerC